MVQKNEVMSPLLFEFPHQYEVETDVDLPSGPRAEQILRVENPSHGSRAITTLLVRVVPHGSPAWLGEFAGYSNEPPGISAVASCPNDLQICVICAGSGYVVRVEDPTHYESIPCFPVRDIIPIRPEGLLVIYDFNSMVAYGRTGLQWRADAVVPDDLAVDGVGGGFIEISGWDPAINSRVTVRLSTGSGRQHGG
jgi:hypothetical protein